MTKEELKNALINHGLSPPPASAKKEEFVAMYEEHVAPIDQDAGEFSSDDEVTLSPRKKVSQSSAKSTSSSKASKKGRKSASGGDQGEESSLVVGDLDVDSLEDEELFNLLKENGIAAGPIVASTRPFYKKKLALILKGESMNGTANGSANGGDAFSDTEPEDEEEDQPSAVISPKVETRTSTRSRVSSSSKKSNKSATQSPPASEPRTGLRKRINIADEIDSSLSRNTPTPRRSIHTYKITETTRTTEVLNKDGVQSRDTERILERSQSAGTLGGAAGSFPWRKLVVGLLILALLVAVGLYLANQKKGAVSVDSIMDSLKESIKSAPAAEESATPKPAATPAPRQAMPDQPAVADV